MKLTITNLEQVPDDLEPGVYCCRLESATWQELKVRFVPGSQHQSGDCLIQLTKEPAEPSWDVPMVCTACRKPVVGYGDGEWLHRYQEDIDHCSRTRSGPVKAMVAAGNEKVTRC